MANENRVSGILFVKYDGNQIDVMGDWTWNILPVKREAEVGTNKTHGYKELPKVQFVEGEARDNKDLDIEAFQGITNSTIVLELANGKTVILRNAWFASDGDVGTESANMKVRFEGMSGEII